MSTLSRKQREIQERERMLLGIARRMLLEQGFAGLSMDRLAEATEYSKGTIYQHFSTKEDLVTALAVESNEQRLALFSRARSFAGRPRERMLAFGVADELFARLHPHFYGSELVVRMADLGNRVSGERRVAFERQDLCILGWLGEIVQGGHDAGDLPLRAPWSRDRVVFALLTQALGLHSAEQNFPHLLRALDGVDPQVDSRASLHALCDGLGWRPLSAEWDYDATFRRILQEVFAREARHVGLA